MEQILSPLVGMVGLLVVIGFLPPIAARLALPSTVLLAAAGAGLGIASHALRAVDGMGPAGDFLQALRGMEMPAEGILYLFLPILLFETALAVDVRRLMDDIAPILLMAIVAVLVCTLFIGFALAPFSKVGLVACLMLGAILATTDPGAVIGIFRDLGAPRRLSLLVEGESLLNDAAAIATFGLLLTILSRNVEPDFAHLAVDLAMEFVGGILIGWALARATVLIIPLLRDIAPAEVTITVALAYLAFIIGQAYAGVSGVVAVVTAALVIGSTGRTHFSAASWNGLKHVWEQLGFWGSSLLFVMAGMVVPPVLMDVSLADLGRLGVVIVAALLARAVVLYGMLPLLSMAGLAERVSPAFSLVMLWGGLRGAVSVALALAVTENKAVPADVQRFVAVLATGYVLFTLLVQGTTLRPLMHLLKLDRLPPEEQALRNRVLALSLTEIRDSLVALARDYRLAPSQAQTAAEYYERRLAEAERELNAGDALTSVDRQTFGLAILAAHEQELVLKRYADGLISRHMVQRAMLETGRLVDAARGGGAPAYVRAARRILAYGRAFRAALWLHNRLGIDRPLANLLARRFEQMVLQRAVLRDLRDFVRARIGQVLGTETAEDLGRLIETRIAAVEQQFEAFKLQYPDYANELQRRYIVRRAILREVDAYRELYADGVIGREVFDNLQRDAMRLDRELAKRPQLDLGLDREQLVARVPIFAGLPPDRVKAIARLLRPRLAIPGQVQVRRGSHGDSMCFIGSGAVQVNIPGRAEPIRLGSGEFFGELALLTKQPRMADVVAIAYCQLLFLDERDFDRLRRTDPDLNAHIEAVAAARLGSWAQGTAGTPATATEADPAPA